MFSSLHIRIRISWWCTKTETYMKTHNMMLVICFLRVQVSLFFKPNWPDMFISWCNPCPCSAGQLYVSRENVYYTYVEFWTQIRSIANISKYDVAFQNWFLKHRNFTKITQHPYLYHILWSNVRVCECVSGSRSTSHRECCTACAYYSWDLLKRRTQFSMRGMLHVSCEAVWYI